MKTKKQLLRAEADKYWHQAVFNKYGQVCEVCGRLAVHSHHFYPKGLYSSLRYEISNGVPLCFHCHFSRHHKGDPKINQTIIAKRGKSWYAKLKHQAQNPPSNYQTTIGYYETAIKELQ